MAKHPADQQYLNRQNRYTQARYGTAYRVDYENWVMDISWDQYPDQQDEVPIPLAFSSPRAMLGGMPEIGSNMVADFTHGNQHQHDAAINTYTSAGMRAGINQRLQSLRDRPELPPEAFHIPDFRRKFRKLYPGEIIGSSTYGSDLLLDDQVLLQGMMGDEIRIDPRDQSINTISLQNYQITDASRHLDGWIYREIRESFNEDGSLKETFYEPDTRQPYSIDSSSKKRWYRTISGDQPVEDYYIHDNFTSSPLVEVRSEVREVGFGVLPLVDQNVEADQWADNNEKLEVAARRGNLIETTQGTLVGYDPTHSNYGKVLRPQIFIEPDTADIDVKEIPVEEGLNPDYTPVRYLAAAQMWKMPFEFSQTRMYISKEGHIHMHVGATYAKEDCPYDPQIEHPFGAGRSVEASFAGSIKAVIDKNAAREESLDLKTIGKVYFHYGKDDGSVSATRRSLAVDSKEYPGGVSNPKISSAQGVNNPDARHLSLEGVTDGGVSLRIGRTHGRNKRVFEQNGFTADGKKIKESASGYLDVRNVKRATYPRGDKFYRYHNLAQAGLGAPGRVGGTEDDTRKGDPVSDIDLMGTSLDAHLVGSAFLRMGADSDNNSLLLDTDGGLVAWLGAESRDNRSLTMTTDGGIELNLGKTTNSGYSIQGALSGGINLQVNGGNTNKDFVAEMRGDQTIRYVGRHSVEVQGNSELKVAVDLLETIGGKHNVSIMKDSYMSVNGVRAVTVGNVPPQGVADSLSIVSGNREVKIETQGDLYYETRLGKVLIQTLKGNAEFRTLIGDMIIQALSGNVLIEGLHTDIGVPGMAKFPVQRDILTPCILSGIPLFGGSPFVSCS